MKRKILKLSEPVINQIAAGEVVESPASIVKELVENSLDAGSKCISIDVEGGGLDLIRVEDDGLGMDEENALLSLERHATSKIESVEDLCSLNSMGFRGEALAAISSVSKFEMKTSDGKRATKIASQGGRIEKVEPCARNQGTTIEIRSLFFNVPARKKFQKSAASCMAQIRRIFETLALAHEDVAFSLNKEAYHPTGQKERIEEILGEHEHRVETSRVLGFFKAPSMASANRRGQYVYINRRPIFSPLIAKAVKEAYATRVGEHSFPRFVLFLKLPPDQVDVNVHPQKKEARFKNDGSIFQMVKNAVEKAFQPECAFTEEVHFKEPDAATEIDFSESFPSPTYKVEDVELDFVYKDHALGVFGKFLLLQKKTLVLVDLKAAHARVLFESMTFHKGKPQMLMVPIEVPIDPEDAPIAEKLEQHGFEIRLFKKLLIVDAIPSFIAPENFPDFFEQFKKGKKMEETATRFTSICQKNYPLDEAMLIWETVKTCKDTFYDPLGNPISVEVSLEDLERIMGKNGTSKTVKVS